MKKKNKAQKKPAKTNRQMKTQSQKYFEIINKLSEGDLEIMGISLYPKELKEMLLRAPLIMQKNIIADTLKADEIINSLSENALKGIRDFTLMITDKLFSPKGMKEFILSEPLFVQKSIIANILKEGEIINGLGEDSLDKIGQLLMPEEMRKMLLRSPLSVQKTFIDEHLQEQIDKMNRKF